MGQSSSLQPNLEPSHIGSTPPQETADILATTLKHYFGYDAFRPGQRQIMQAALERRDQLVIMPTGGGKSLCFQLPALMQPGLTIVVSPLIALMQDQVQALTDNGIAATCLNSSVDGAALRERWTSLRQGTLKLLYVAPERLLMADTLAELAQVELAGLVIDEAHCVSDWGHDFRPEYRQLRQLRQQFPGLPVMALTATATERVRTDIIEQLGLRQPQVHLASFNRPNLYYEVRSKHSQSFRELVELIRQNQEGAGIVYCLSRRRVDELVGKLQSEGIGALPYHAGLDAQTRAENQNRWLRDDAQVMVATVAFGMGINKPDVRFVVHYELSRSLEGYYQEAGRAGRDGAPARCTLFFGGGDVKTVEFLIAQKVHPQTGEPLEDEQRVALQQLRRVVNYAEATDCRRRVQLSYFGEDFAGNCGNCDNCCHPKPVEDWTIAAQKFLSCVARCRERFGTSYIIDVLRGSRSERILTNGHDQLSTYGIGQEHSLEEWRLLARSLIHQRLVDESSNGYAVLKLNPRSWEVLRQQRRVMVAIVRKASRGTGGTSFEATTSVASTTTQLYQRLQALRKRLADAQNVPPYIVFANTSLQQMAELQPQTQAEFAQIPGVGMRKLANYGDAFLAEIRDFCAAQQTDSRL